MVAGGDLHSKLEPAVGLGSEQSSRPSSRNGSAFEEMMFRIYEAGRIPGTSPCSFWGASPTCTCTRWGFPFLRESFHAVRSE